MDNPRFWETKVRRMSGISAWSRSRHHPRIGPPNPEERTVIRHKSVPAAIALTIAMAGCEPISTSHLNR